VKRIVWLRLALVVFSLLFVLAGAAAQPPPLFCAIIADTQKGDGDPFADFRWAVEQINGLRPQFVLFPGDLTSTGTVNQYENWTAVRRDLQVPLYACPGNHEGYPGPQEYAARFRQFLGYPTCYSRRLGGWTLFALDGVTFEGGEVQSQGRVSPERLQWLRSEAARLAPQQPALLMCHFSFFPLPGRGQMDNAEEVLACFDGTYLAYTVAGHWHVNARRRDERGRLHLVTGSLSFAFDPQGLGYRLLSTVGLDLYTAWVGREVTMPLALLAENSGASPLAVATPAEAPGLVVRVGYQGGPARVRLTGPWGLEWVAALPEAREATQALIPLNERWRERLSGEGDLRLWVEPLGATRVHHQALYTSPLAWEHHRLTGPPPEK
jgi:hypothetical protein